MNEIEVLKASDFGRRTAEEEVDAIEEYFVETDQWDKVRAGDIDIIYGAKGSGKSAIYNLILKKTDEFFDDGIILVSGERPQGSPVFKSVMECPPDTENDFSDLWKVYSLALMGNSMREFEISNKHATKVIAALEGVGLLPVEFTLTKILKYAFDYVKKMAVNVEEIEGSFSVDPASYVPSMGGKILFREPTIDQAKYGAVSVDEMLEDADAAFESEGLTIWLLFDRLDVAFSEDEEVESKALRGLFKYYLDTKHLRNLKLKIFLRSDIWSRISEKGFREASHIERSTTITWRDDDLLNLAVRRMASNSSILDFFSEDKKAVLLNQESQSNFFYRACPEQVETGLNKPNTFNWILGRTRDAVIPPFYMESASRIMRPFSVS